MSSRTSCSRGVSDVRSAASGAGVGAAGVALDQTPRDRGRQQRLAGRHHPHGMDEVLAPEVLEQEPARARLQRVEDVLVEVEGREDHDLHRILHTGSGETPRRLDPVHARHADVHEHDIGPRPAA